MEQQDEQKQILDTLTVFTGFVATINFSDERENTKILNIFQPLSTTNV